MLDVGLSICTHFKTLVKEYHVCSLVDVDDNLKTEVSNEETIFKNSDLMKAVLFSVSSAHETVVSLLAFT